MLVPSNVLQTRSNITVFRVKMHTMETQRGTLPTLNRWQNSPRRLPRPRTRLSEHNLRAAFSGFCRMLPEHQQQRMIKAPNVSSRGHSNSSRSSSSGSLGWRSAQLRNWPGANGGSSGLPAPAAQLLRRQHRCDAPDAVKLLDIIYVAELVKGFHGMRQCALVCMGPQVYQSLLCCNQ